MTHGKPYKLGIPLTTKLGLNVYLHAAGTRASGYRRFTRDIVGERVENDRGQRADATGIEEEEAVFFLDQEAFELGVFGD